ncbi:MAG: Rpn family recombination-promoting nuclease/putative transposase, partial [Deltaproteobacteria bacterium]|nr:Rpn family recombination-promoting nuclease/putative transposase [Deltaproteobacteria bacterium]
MTKSILSPKNDFVFKLLFGEAENCKATTGLLSSVLKIDPEQLSDLSFLNPFLYQDSEKGKEGILDVKVKTKTAEIIDIEMQILKVPDLPERIFFYKSKLVLEQIGRGNDYSVIKKVYNIIITDHIYVKENPFYHNRFFDYNPDYATPFKKVSETHILELPKLPKKSDGALLWSWLKFFKVDSEEDLNMV